MSYEKRKETDLEAGFLWFLFGGLNIMDALESEEGTGVAFMIPV